MKPYDHARRTAARAVSLLAAGLLSACSMLAGPGSGDGKVIDFVSKEPISQAAVTLTCTVPRMVHGSDKKIRETVSAADGSYHFDPSGLHDCDFFFARAVKAGYGLDSMTDSLTNPGPDTSRQIPKIVYLIKESDQPMVLLERLADYTPVAPFVAGPNATYYFYVLYKSFTASRRIAATPKMDAWVREHYCARLNASWRVLSDQQRVGLKEDGHSPIDGSPISMRPDSYEKDVRPYCGA